MLGQDQPVYAIHARGFDGKEPPLKNIRDMVIAYFKEIRRERPNGPYVVGGMCMGGLVALEIAQELASRGEKVGRVLLLDPVPVQAQWSGWIDGAIAEDAKVCRQLHRNLMHFFEAITQQWPNIPLDVRDPRRLHIAIKLAVTNIAAAHVHVPVPYAGATELIISEQRAVGYFHPASPWRKIL